jgi:hypothetical protein
MSSRRCLRVRRLADLVVQWLRRRLFRPSDPPATIPVVPDRTWTWGSLAPDFWFEDRANESILVRGYLTARAEPSMTDGEDSMMTYHFRDRDFAVSVRKDGCQVPVPVTMQYVGGGKIVAVGVGQTRVAPPARVPPVGRRSTTISPCLDGSTGWTCVTRHRPHGCLAPAPLRANPITCRRRRKSSSASLL